MSQESDVCCTTSMYDIQNRCIPDEIDLFYFKTCIITHNNKVIEQNINVSMFDILSVKEPRSHASSVIQNKRQESEDDFITFDGKVIHDEFTGNKELLDRLVIVFFAERTKNDWVPTGLDERRIFIIKGIFTGKTRV